MAASKKPAKKPAKQAKTKARSREQIDQDRELIGAMFLKRVSLRNIAKRVKLSHTHVEREITAIRAIWAKQSADILQDLLNTDLRRLEMIEAEAWQMWAKSCRPRKSNTTITTTKQIALKNEFGSELSEPFDETKVTVHSSGQNGDPRYLQIVKECIIERHKLLGTYDKKEGDDEDGPVEAVRMEQTVYLSGVGELSPEILKEMMTNAQSQGQDLWHMFEALLPNQDPHVWHGDEDASSS